MKTDLWYDHFLDSLYEKYPHKAQLTEALMEILSIERESAYRRLRKEVIFPIYEMVKIAKAWNISLDALIGVSKKQTHPFRLQVLKYLNPSKEDISKMEEMIDFLNQFASSTDAEYMEVTNTLPRTLVTGFPQLARYSIFKWMYQYGTDNNVYPFAKVIPSEKVRRIGLDYHACIKKVANVSYIWDPMLFKFLTNDIKFFASIYLISEEDKKLIKEELLSFLDYLSEVSYKGCFPETGNQVNLYISQINLDTNYSYFYSEDIKVCRIRTFLKHEMSSSDMEMTENFKKWMQLKKRSSIQISGVDEPKRIGFFMKQRQLIEEL